MATYTEVKRERQAALRGVRSAQRATDSALERLERRLFRLLDRKTIIDREAALTIVPLYGDFTKEVRRMENAITDFITVSSL